jgi:hypothetical protein
MFQTTPSRPTKPLPKSTWYRIIPTLLLLLAALWFSFTHASPLPYGDEYELTPVLTGHQPLSLTYLLSRHNEHRLPLSRLALHAVLPMVGYDFRYAAMALPLCLGAAALGLAAALARARGHWLWSDNVPALLLLSFGNAETLTWAFNLHFGFQVVLSLAVLACLTPCPPQDRQLQAMIRAGPPILPQEPWDPHVGCAPCHGCPMHNVQLAKT